MSERCYQHIGDDQLIGGMPKRMSARATGKYEKHAGPDRLRKYWRYHPKPQACEKCQAMKDVWFEEKPGPVHPNCQCEIEEFEMVDVNGRTDILIPPGVDLAANIAEAKRMKKQFEAEAKQLAERLEADIHSWFGYGATPKGMKEDYAALLAFYLKCLWIYNNFDTYKKYDYKQKGSQYEAFGNYHYGMYTNAIGIDATIAEVAAGAAQYRSNTWRLRFISTWFDDPLDNAVIRKGQKVEF